jgi:SpoVK/Ycf46/Vps4 family AAA+-type ATPase
LIAFILLSLIAHLIKYIIEECSYGGFYGRSNQEYLEEEDDEFFDNQTKKTNSLEELDKLIGLESVKNQVKRIRAVLLKNKGSNEKLNLHMCFYGNPGTGKTVVARLMANIFYETGVLPTNKLVETDRSGLCGQYIGETAPLTHKKVKEAMGGVLFIDEAYTLYSGSSDGDYGKEAIAALLKDMEDYNGKFCVILAGYRDEMEKMIALNPGFDSRINRKIDFPDYTVDEQLEIFNSMLDKKNYEITEEAKSKLSEIFKLQSQCDNFANARTVRNILDELIEIQALRTMEDDDPCNDNERIIEIEDVEQYYKEN